MLEHVGLWLTTKTCYLVNSCLSASVRNVHTVCEHLNSGYCSFDYVFISVTNCTMPVLDDDDKVIISAASVDWLLYIRQVNKMHKLFISLLRFSVYVFFVAHG